MKTPAASPPQQDGFLQPFWAALIGPPWLVSLAVLVIIATIRYVAVFSPFRLPELFFLQTVGMWAIPFLVLNSAGRRQIGLTERGVAPASVLVSSVAGAMCGLIFFALGMALFGDTADNWCVSVRNYIHLDDMRGLMSPAALFGLYALPAIFLNPVGEEILFRGLIYQSFARRFNSTIALLVSSVLFGLIYLYLHGVWHDPAGFHIRVASAAVAVVLMSCSGGIFTLCRQLSGSLWAAMAAHAAFNLTILALTIHKFLR